MRWQEVIVTTNHEAVEAVSNYFHELGAGGVVMEDPLVLQQYTTSGQWDYYDIPVERLEAEYVLIKGYLPVDPKLPFRLEDLKSYLTILKTKLPQCHFGVDMNLVDEEDWANSWKVYYKPAKISASLTIVPSWEDYVPEAGEEIILLDPGMAFGTGTHHTTQLAAQLLEQVVQGQEIVYDIGTGSGVLSLAAAKLGVAKVYATDIDSAAVEIAKKNMILNQVEHQVEVIAGNLLEPLATAPKPQIIMANIIADVILLLAHDSLATLVPGGYFVVSGIIISRRDEVIERLTQAGFKIIEQLEAGEWVAILAKKEQV